MPGLIAVSEFVEETREDYNSPTTSTFVSRMPQCRQTITSLEEVSVHTFIHISFELYSPQLYKSSKYAMQDCSMREEPFQSIFPLRAAFFSSSSFLSFPPPPEDSVSVSACIAIPGLDSRGRAYIVTCVRDTTV